ncbi:MAG: ATP-binding protein [Deltaproteobacteria bacterium]|nr:MAG: ATP-binding protein [Deltaproteobacteria bacterium]
MEGRGASRILSLRVPARADQLRRVREEVRAAVDGCGCSAQAAGDIVLAVDEACQNIIRHAYGDACEGSIAIEIERVGDELVFSLVDSAPPLDPRSVKPRDLDDLRPGGLGTHLIRTVMDETDFARHPSGAGNLLRMVKRIT